MDRGNFIVKQVAVFLNIIQFNNLMTLLSSSSDTNNQIWLLNLIVSTDLIQ